MELKPLIYQEHYNIVRECCELAFGHLINSDLIFRITDYIHEFKTPVPGKGIDILKSFYFVLNDNTNINSDDLRTIICEKHNTLDITEKSDITNFIGKGIPLTIIYLDHLISHFQHPSNHFISLKELENVYKISCENCEFFDLIGNVNECERIIKKLQENILGASNKNLIEKIKFSTETTIEPKFFYLKLPHIFLKEELDQFA
ncbi:MAG: hypothetical protein ACXABO_06165 [Promethearchaeota archaeon]